MKLSQSSRSFVLALIFALAASTHAALAQTPDVVITVTPPNPTVRDDPVITVRMQPPCQRMEVTPPMAALFAGGGNVVIEAWSLAVTLPPGGAGAPITCEFSRRFSELHLFTTESSRYPHTNLPRVGPGRLEAGGVYRVGFARAVGISGGTITFATFTVQQQAITYDVPTLSIPAVVALVSMVAFTGGRLRASLYSRVN